MQAESRFELEGARTAAAAQQGHAQALGQRLEVTEVRFAQQQEQRKRIAIDQVLCTIALRKCGCSTGLVVASAWRM